MISKLKEGVCCNCRSVKKKVSGCGFHTVEGLFLSYYEMPGPHSGEKLNWLKGSSVEGRKEGRRTERGNYWGRNPVRVRVNPSPRVALCRIDNREVDANFSFCQNTSSGFSIRQIWTSANSCRLVRGYVLPYLKIKRVKNSQELHFTNIFHKLTFDYYD